MNPTPRLSGLRRTLDEIVKDYPASITAIEHLKKTRVPNAASFDLSHPGAGVYSAIVAIVALVQHIDGPGSTIAVANVEKYWSSVLHPWIVFLLRQICQLEGEPSTPEGIDAFENILASIPPVLALPLPRFANMYPVSHCFDPTIKPLVVQIWLRAVEQHHITWGPWSGLMAYMAKSWPALVPSLDYTHDINLGSVFLRHLECFTQAITTLPFVSNIANFLNVISLDGNIQECPIFVCGSLREATIGALVRLTSGLARRKRKGYASDKLKKEALREAIFVAIRLLTLVIVDPSSVVSALNAGVLEMIVKVHKCFSIEEQRADLSTNCLTLLDTISTYLIWPSVLRHFVKTRKKLPASSRLEMEMKTKDELVWEAWESTKAKANELGDFWRDLKKQVSPLCNYHQLTPLSAQA
ncbi:hypothetical protein V5O48_005261 [Marasmius crinis-equi]|uniref:Uncharacterized protein n=1 Tax=Marasmius crinis-equi TaxID=585013 RepID=A0ABR3FMU0_9AGAR